MSNHKVHQKMYFVINVITYSSKNRLKTQDLPH